MSSFFKSFLVIASMTMAIGTAEASVINFDDQGLTGPSVFASTTPQDVNILVGTTSVNITGGTILDNTAFLPGNTTAVYGTANFFPGGLNPLVITFSDAITNFFLDVYNGNTTDVEYVVSDNAGNSTSIVLPSNSSGGFATVGFAATGTIVSIFAKAPIKPSCCAFDFFIDNIHFNEALPTAVPLPAALPLLMGGLLGLGAVGAFRRKSTNA